MSAMSAADVNQFIALSAVLTGFPASEIGDPLDPDQLATVYFGVLTTHAGAGVAAILAAFAQAQADSGGDSQKLVNAVAARIWNDATLGPLAKSITRLWYLGKWYDGPDPVPDVPYVSEAAYIRALAWKAMDAKAVGYSEFVDQYWKDPPPTVKTS